jgi:hypothetical protein
MVRSKAKLTPLAEKRLKYQALIAQINYLRSPCRTDGPSRYEAEEVIQSLEREAELLAEELFYLIYYDHKNC